ncbi:MAG: hypothetical protein KDB23_20085 [Planctomycetales bacterium]|nr:hypothetical protein [Planctomycetales bacterium]
MRGLTLHLLRKELYELRWQAFASFLIAGCITCMLFFTSDDSRGRNNDSALLAQGAVVAFLGAIVSGSLFGMQAATGDRTAGTNRFVRALPVSTRLLGTVRLIACMIAGWATFVPILILCIEVPFANALIVVASGMILEVGVMLWVAAAGVGRATEVSAVLAGWMAIMLWLGIFAIYAMQPYRNETIVIGLLSVGPMFDIPLPGGSAATGQQFSERAGRICINAIACFCASMIFVRRYDAALRPLAANPQHRISWSGLKLHTMTRYPLLWKSLRDVSPLAVLLPVWFWLLPSLAIGLGDPAGGIKYFYDNFVSRFFFPAGMILPVFLGVSLFAGDLQPQLNRFWRSRPISAARWYWTRLGVGFAALTITCWLPLLVAAVRWDHVSGEEIGVYAAVCTCTYFSAAAVSCLVRRSLYSGILAIGVVSVTAATVSTVDYYVFRYASVDDESVLAVSLLCTGALMLGVGAWLAVRDIHLDATSR